MRFAWIPAALAVGVVVFASCEDSTPPSPNQPPETIITSSVPGDSSRVPHHVEIHWRGADADGTPAYYEYILDTYPRSADTVDDFTVTVPGVGDPRWASGRITANNRVIIALADTLRVDPRPTPPPPLLFDRWHTFFVRAVDNEGAIDETPDVRTFQAFTAAPVLAILEPALFGDAPALPRTVVMHWDGYDPIGTSGGDQNPQDARWVLLRCELDGGGDPLGFPDSLYALTESRWSAWAPWSSADGRTAVLRDLPTGSGREAYVFAVQGRDDGGAITPRFDASADLSNNYAAFVADAAVPTGPALTIFVQHARVDTLHVRGNGAPSLLQVFAGTDSVSVSWNRPEARHYGAAGTDTRYGWDIVAPEQDLEWTTWSTIRSAPRRAVDAGHDLFLQGRDDVGRSNAALHQVTTVQIQIRPAPAKRR